jgi:RecA/RadA recombinase
MPKSVRNAEDVTHCTLKLIEKLVNADNMSTQEALDLLRILKNNSLPEGEEAVFQILSREELIEKINLTQELINLKKATIE